jgi:FAD binding domain in molybdopterin dehydrogenase
VQPAGAMVVRDGRLWRPVQLHGWNVSVGRPFPRAIAASPAACRLAQDRVTFPRTGKDKVGLTFIGARGLYSAEVARNPAISMTMPAVNQMNSTGMDDNMGRTHGERPRRGGLLLVARGSPKVQPKRSIGGFSGNAQRKREAPQAGPSEGGNAMITRRQHCRIPLAQPNEKAVELGHLLPVWPFRHTLRSDRLCRRDFASPELVIDIGRLDELRAIAHARDHVLLGACVTHAAIEDGAVPDPAHGFLADVASGAGGDPKSAGANSE